MEVRNVSENFLNVLGERSGKFALAFRVVAARGRGASRLSAATAAASTPSRCFFSFSLSRSRLDDTRIVCAPEGCGDVDLSFSFLDLPMLLLPSPLLRPLSPPPRLPPLSPPPRPPPPPPPPMVLISAASSAASDSFRGLTPPGRSGTPSPAPPRASELFTVTGAVLPKWMVLLPLAPPLFLCRPLLPLPALAAAVASCVAAATAAISAASWCVSRENNMRPDAEFDANDDAVADTGDSGRSMLLARSRLV
mmetsp:Transcript_40045/g.98248  ORF Transcript_40045/g.98248 Transcript_40045/m.98248 type:complete len:251 (+) Transcript_40045:503-1255(+)